VTASAEAKPKRSRQSVTDVPPQTSPAADRRNAFLAIAAIAAAIAIYAPVLYWLALNWAAVDDASHGFLIVPLALYFAWEKRPQIARAKIEPSWWGLPFLAVGALALTIGRLGVEFTMMRIGFVLTLMGLVLLMLGRRIFGILLFPLAFLFLMIPIPQSILNVVAFPLQLIAADLAVQSLYYLHIPALREGNIIHLANQTLFVAEACSGIRSLMALLTLGIVFAYFFRRSWTIRAILVLSAIPIAILVNAFRVALTGVLTHYYGEAAASGWIHETEGFFTFGIAFVLLMLLGSGLQWVWPDRGRTARRAAARAEAGGTAR
jgi:exosortase